MVNVNTARGGKNTKAESENSSSYKMLWELWGGQKREDGKTTRINGS